MFVLTTIVIISAALYDRALSYSARIEQRQRAAEAAGLRMEQLRAWSRDAHGTNGTTAFSAGWDTFDGSSITYPDYPGFTVETRIETRSVLSPGSEFESARFAVLEDENIPDTEVGARTLESSAVLATVTSSWGTGVTERVVIRSLITEPLRDLGFAAANLGDAIHISYSTGGVFSDSPPAALAIGAEVALKASIKDLHGQVVENAIVQWYIDPDSTGDGTLLSSPATPSQVTFRNLVTVDKDPEATGDEIPVYPGGTIRLVARVRLGGVDAFQKSQPIGLAN